MEAEIRKTNYTTRGKCPYLLTDWDATYTAGGHCPLRTRCEVWSQATQSMSRYSRKTNNATGVKWPYLLIDWEAPYTSCRHSALCTRYEVWVTRRHRLSKETCTSYLKIVIRIPNTLHSTLTFVWLGLCIGSSTDLCSVQSTQHVKQVWYMVAREHHIFLVSLSLLPFNLGYGYVCLHQCKLT